MAPADIEIVAGAARLAGTLEPAGTGEALVLFAHGSGNSRHSPRNRTVARALHDAGVGTLLFDLLTRDEEASDRYAARLRFDIDLLAGRLIEATQWVLARGEAPRAIGYFGASTGAAAALTAAAVLGERVGAVVSRGGRPDLAARSLAGVSAATLLIVGGLDLPVIALNEQAYERLSCEKELVIVPAAGHLFEEPRAQDRVSALAVEWFGRYLLAAPQGEAAVRHDMRSP